MMERRSTKALRLPHSLKAAAKLIADREGISLNEFIAGAVADKVKQLEVVKEDESGDRDNEIAPG
jgi:hypothetical protein